MRRLSFALVLVIAACNGIFETDFVFKDVEPSGTGGEGGAGGQAACVDQDGDMSCAEDDCDDGDPYTFPGNTEICGNLQDNNCDDEVDDPSLCMGLGTFVSDFTGSPNGSGTQADPVDTIAAGIQKATTIGGGVDVYVAEGNYNEAITLVEGMSLFGGLDCAGDGCTWERNPDISVSALNAPEFVGLVATSEITRDTVVSGFRIAGVSTTADGETGAAITIQGGAPIIRDNTIVGALLSNCAGSCSATGVLVTASNNGDGPLIDSNEVQIGVSTNIAYGIGVINGGIADVRNNRIFSGSAREAYGIYVDGNAASGETFVRNNTVTSPGCVDDGGAIVMSGRATVDGNLVNLGGDPIGACTNTRWAAGIVARGGGITITNNIARGGDGDQTAALWLLSAGNATPSYIVNGNTFLSGPGSTSAALVLELTTGSGPAGRIRNNIFIGDGPATGIYEDGTDAPLSAALIEHNAFSNITIAYRDYEPGNVSNLPAVEDMEGAIADTLNNRGGCSVDDDYHLTPGSECIDAGTSSEAPPIDVDGDVRPMGMGIDIGADEVRSDP